MTAKAVRMGRQMLAVYKALDPFVVEAAAKVGSQCKRGCSHCCYQLVTVTLPEALAVVERLVQPEWHLEYARLQYVMRQSYDVLRDPALTSTSYFARQIPCVFLSSAGECRIYDVRPSPCRFFHVVTDPSHCAYGAEDPGVVRLNPLPLEARIWEASILAMRQAGLDVLVVAPLQIALSWAWQIRTEGVDGFVRSLATLDGAMHPSYWLEDSLLLQELNERRVEMTVEEYRG